MHIYLYGPPGSGKTTLARALAGALDLPFRDLDREIEEQAGMSIPDIFMRDGEAGFRERELSNLRVAAGQAADIIALGGGALLDSQARAIAEASGQVLCLEADSETLLERMKSEDGQRPLLSGDQAVRLQTLLAERAGHYQSFALRLNTNRSTLEELTWQAQVLLGAFRVRGMGQAYDVRIESGGLRRLGEHLGGLGLKGPVALVSDRNVGALYLEQIEAALSQAGYVVHSYCIEPGEAHKTIETVLAVWDFFVQAGVERGSTVVALGGGVVGDLAGFAAATFLRGVAWVNLPTSLLAMVDSSMGGKTGIDLPQAKNLVGAFYPPRLVLVDPQVLTSLPDRELRNGLAEVVKHGIIADPGLFELCEGGWGTVTGQLDRVVRRGMAVKLKVIEVDPFEKGLRQALNLGHTIGHGVELASEFHLSHGEAVAIGTLAEARLAEQAGLAQMGLSGRIAGVLAGLGLPGEIPADISRERIVQAMQHDKKRAAGKLLFALPATVGEVRTGVVINGWETMVKSGG